MKVYTDSQLAILREKAIEMAEEAVMRSGKGDPNGERVAKMALYFYKRREEWAELINLPR